MFLTYRYRIKDKRAAKRLDAHARAVNYVWNYCCDAQRHAMKWCKKWPTWVDLINATSGTSRELGIHSATIAGTCRQFHESRSGIRRCPRFRGRRSLGWIPFSTVRAIKIKGETITYLGRKYRVWLSRPIPENVSSGSFSRDARGRWYINLRAEVRENTCAAVGEVGIDLGLKTLASLSDGATIENPRHVAKYAAELATAQRAGRKKRAAAIHAKIANCRRHHLHEQSTRLVREYQRIVVGNVNASGLAKTRLSKSVLDAGWSSFRNMLAYKAITHGCEYVEADERFSSQLCSACGARSGPKGIAQLRVREWACSSCGAVHDRDQNAAMNILIAGAECRPPVDGKRAA